MKDVEALVVTISIAVGIVWVVLVGLLLLLRVAPKPIQERVTAGITRWNRRVLEVFPRFIYWWAVLMVVMFALTLITAVAYLFVAH